MGSKFTRYLLITIIVLIVLFIVARIFYNYKVNDYEWDDDDRQVLIDRCIDGTAHYGIRFPKLTVEYCSCSTDSIMKNVKKAEYLQISTKTMNQQEKVLMPIIKDCYNRYQTQIFESTELGEP